MTPALPDLMIREPHESEYPACRMLVPEACADSIGRMFRLAFDASGAGIIGALSFRDDGKALGGLTVHVVPTRRREGIGSGLIAYCLDCARNLGRKHLAADADLIRNPQAEAFLIANGFHRTSTVTTAEGTLEHLRAHTPYVQSRLATREGLPESARFVGLDEAPLDQILRLYAENIRNMAVIPGLRRAFQLERYTESVVLMIGDEVAGFILGELNGDVLRIPAWVVAPKYRTTAAGPLLRIEVCKRPAGRYERVQFEFLEQAAATAKVTRDGGYDIVRVMARFERDVHPLT